MSRILTTMARGCAILMLVAPALAGPARSAAFDAPTISYVDAGLFQVTLQVRAGTSGAPNGFQVEWMRRADFARLGGWPEAADPAHVSCAFVGTPTLNLWGASDFRLAPLASAIIQPGDLFDETGVVTTAVDELDPGLDVPSRGLRRYHVLDGPAGRHGRRRGPDRRRAGRPLP